MTETVREYRPEDVKPGDLSKRRCAAPDCRVVFTPTRWWQRFHRPACRVAGFQRRSRQDERRQLTERAKRAVEDALTEGEDE